MPDDLVWEAKLDGLYDCRVIRLEPCLGELRISRRTGELLGVGLVTFSYSAMFGPDVDDISDWQAWIMEFIEGEPGARNPIRPSLTTRTDEVRYG